MSSNTVAKNALELKEFMAKSSTGGMTTPVPRATPNADALNFFIETYGCQMNTSDSEIVRSILLNSGHVVTTNIESADLILVNTCAIRDNAEEKIWHRLDYFQSLRSKNRHNRHLSHSVSSSLKRKFYPLVGVLGCMAERLKTKLLDEDGVDFVTGPDAYRDIPKLLEAITSSDQKAANTQLSLEETYANISPVRETDSCSAFVSIMRGCNNMCSFCIVPFTRGRERSRELSSILHEVRRLAEQGVREVVLLGQNVNGYHDVSKESAEAYQLNTSYNKSSPEFKNLFESKNKSKPGARFADALAAIAAVHPELRVRFTSPHPKDFPPEVLQVVANTPNVCAALHLPAQSGSSSVLRRMRRGYSREAYLQLVQQVRATIPGVTISTDVISGFCGETNEEHEDTVSMMDSVEFDQAFMFCYSLRDRTHAAHNMSDDVPEEVKLQRLQQVIETFRSRQMRRNVREELGKLRLVLVEGPAKKSAPDRVMLTGRTDGNKRVVFPLHPLFKSVSAIDESSRSELASRFEDANRILFSGDGMSSEACKEVSAQAGKVLTESVSSLLTRSGGASGASGEELIGSYVVVLVTRANGPTLHAVPIAVSSIAESGSKGYVSF